MASPELEKLYQEATGPDSAGKEASDLEDLSVAQPGMDFIPPQEGQKQEEEKPEEKKLTFDYKKSIEDSQEEEFMTAITVSYTFEKLATIIEKYGEANHLPDMLIQASKIRKGALSEAITREFGIRDQYEILVKEMLGKPGNKI